MGKDYVFKPRYPMPTFISVSGFHISLKHYYLEEINSPLHIFNNYIKLIFSYLWKNSIIDMRAVVSKRGVGGNQKIGTLSSPQKRAIGIVACFYSIKLIILLLILEEFLVLIDNKSPLC